MSVRLAAGRLRHRVTLQRLPDTRSGAGNEPNTDDWETFASNVPAEVLPLSGKEIIAAQAVQSETTHKVTIHWRRGINTKCRLLYCGSVLEIESAINLEGANVAIEMLCKETPA